MSTKIDYSKLTSLYSLQKTLRFSAVPTDQTIQNLLFKSKEDFLYGDLPHDDDGDARSKIKEDKKLEENSAQIKDLINQLHINFINHCLERIRNEDDEEDESEIKTSYNLIFEEYNLLQSLKSKRQKAKKDKTDFKHIDDQINSSLKQYDNLKTKLREKFKGLFDEYANVVKERWETTIKYELNDEKFNIKASGIKILFCSEIIKVLEVFDIENDLFELIKDQDKLAERKRIVSRFHSFFTYLRNFNTTRDNIYLTGGEASSIFTRLIDQNLERFIQNINHYKESIKLNNDEKTVLNKDEIVKNSSDYELLDKDLFDINCYSRFITQNEINKYNSGKDYTTENNKTGLGIGLVADILNKEMLKNYKTGYKSRFNQLYKIQLSKKEVFIKEYNGEEIIKLIDQSIKEDRAYNDRIYEVLVDAISDESRYQSIYIKSNDLNKLSSKYFGGSNWYLLKTAMKKLGSAKAKKGEIEIDKFVTLETVKEAFKILTIDDNNKQAHATNYVAKDLFRSEYFAKQLKGEEYEENIFSLFKKLWISDLKSIYDDKCEYSKYVEKYITINKEYKPSTKIPEFNDFTQANIVKEYLDKVTDFYHNAHYFYLVVRKDDFGQRLEGLDTVFNAEINNYFDNYFPYYYYNLIRNFSTKKQYSINKFKLNFENSKLLDGWDQNKEIDNNCIILKNSDTDYELVVMTKGNNKLFYDHKVSSKNGTEISKKLDNPIYNTSSSEMQKMVYKFNSGASKLVPKCTTNKKEVIRFFKEANNKIFRFKLDGKNDFEISREVYELNNMYYDNVSKDGIPRTLEATKKNNDYSKKFQKAYLDSYKDRSGLDVWIDFCKKFYNSYPNTKVFNIKFRETREYKDLADFYADIDNQTYKIDFVNVDKNLIEKYEKEGKILRFKISNNDLSQINKGKNKKNLNLHTIYFLELFKPENVRKCVYKINGGAELFFRPKSIEQKNKNQLKKGGQVPVIQNERFTHNQIQFHLPITINYISVGIENNKNFCDYLDKNLDYSNINYLGIDRGENNLLYMTLVDNKGNIVEGMQIGLNEIEGYYGSDGKKVNFRDKLESKENERDQAKKTWSAINNIKELKLGYLSLAVNKITRFAFENNAVICLENLNYGFKKSRTIKFERSVYQKFEVALAQKLQHLFFKDIENGKAGSITNAIQLCPKFDNSNIEKANRWGIVSYVKAAYTSTTCPLTGWNVSTLPYINNKEEYIKEKFTNKGDIIIGYDKELDCYTFSYTYVSKETGISTLYTLYAHNKLQRIGFSKEKEQYLKKEGALCNEFKTLLDEYLEGGVFNHDEFSKRFVKWAELFRLYKQLVNIRFKYSKNDESKDKIDVIQSPVAYEMNGEKIFFDSRHSVEIGKKVGRILPIDGDANGAYHIALNGIKFHQSLLNK